MGLAILSSVKSWVITNCFERKKKNCSLFLLFTAQIFWLDAGWFKPLLTTSLHASDTIDFTLYQLYQLFQPFLFDSFILYQLFLFDSFNLDHDCFNLFQP